MTSNFKCYRVDTVGTLLAVLQDLPPCTPVVQMNPVGMEDTITVYVENDNGTKRVLIYEG